MKSKDILSWRPFTPHVFCRVLLQGVSGSCSREPLLPEAALQPVADHESNQLQICGFSNLFTSSGSSSWVASTLLNYRPGGSFMGKETHLFETILVPVDFSPCSDEAFRVACQVARLCGATVLVLHVIDTSALAAFNRLGLLAVPSDAAPQRRRLRHHARLKVRQLLESKVAMDVKITRLIVEGVPFVEIAKVARTGDIDLVVIGSYGGRSGSVDRIFFGSTAEKVVRTAGCPVLTVPLEASAPQRKSTR